MAEGNSDAQINAFTTAQANFVNALQQTMLTISNTLGPAVLWLSQNMAAMTALAVLMGSNVLRNLSNILVNQTRANTALEAARNRLNEARNERNTLWGSAREQASALTTQGRLNALQESARQAEQAHQKATKNFLKEYQRAKSQEIQTQRAMNILSQEQARQASNELKNRVKSLASNPIAMASAAVSTTLNPSSTNNAIASANRLLETQRGLTTAQAAANGRVALTFNTAATAAKTFGAAGIAAFNVAMAGAIRLNALLQVAITGFMSVSMAVLGPAGVAYGLYQLGKVGLESVGLLNKNLSEFEDNLIEVNKRLEKTFAKFNEFSSFNVNKLSEGIQAAEYMTNVFDSTNTEISTLMDSLKSDKMKETWLDKANIGESVEQFEKYFKLLNAADKKAVLGKAQGLMEDRASIRQNYAGVSGYALWQGAREAGSSVEGLNNQIRQGSVAFEDYKAIMQTVSDLLKPQSEKFKFYSDSIKDASSAADLFAKSYNSLADTLRSESSFNEPILQLESLKNTLKVTKDTAKDILNTTGLDKNLALGTLNTQVALLNDLRTKVGGSTIDSFLPTVNIEDAAKAVLAYAEQTQKATDIHIASTEAIRTNTIQLTKAADAYDRRLSNMSLSYKRIGLDVSSIIGLMSKLKKLELDGKVNKDTARYLKQFDALSITSSTTRALSDFVRELGFKNKEAKDIIDEASLSISDIARDVFNVPLVVDFNEAM
ncbi:MAG: DUF4200 domain-containing protein, partial [Candidatus Riesia sp.]|nr:DUF4200 domain-containing protein [Candidatus Riesia sp.]